ncbi:hypothetical protein GQR58_008889 [Nymphon striatum]|nr:hypothetical protein GQR58_008889 [Nymphon striatum]
MVLCRKPLYSHSRQMVAPVGDPVTTNSDKTLGFFRFQVTWISPEGPFDYPLDVQANPNQSDPNDTSETGSSIPTTNENVSPEFDNTISFALSGPPCDDVRCGQQDMSADPTIPNKMSDSERSGDYSVHLRYISPELSDIYVDEEKKITDESAAESILVLEPYMFEPYETENENTCLNVIQSRKLKGRLVGHRTSKYGMVMPLVIESWCCREIEEVHCETVRTQQDVLFIVETNSFRIQIVAWMQMFSVAQTMHTSTNMAGMHSNMSKIAVPKKRLLRDYPLLQFHTPFCRNKSQLVFVNIWHPRQSWNSYQRLHWNLRQNYLQKTSTRATLKCLENRTRTIYDAGIIIYHAIEDVCGVSDPWPPTFSSLGIDAVEACVPSPLYKLLAGVLIQGVTAWWKQGQILIYVNTLENLEITHPGCKELLSEKGLSVQGQDRYKCRIAIDQRGEQTINKDAKVSGGIKYFASDENAILKWTLNRSAQAKNTNALMALADVNSSDEGYKSNRPSQILKSENFVENIMNIMTEEYINPFDESLEKDCLYNLSSGIQVELGIANEISQATIEFDVITANGWSEEGKVIWMNEAFPPDVTEILMDTEEDSDLDETLDGESDSDYDSD